MILECRTAILYNTMSLKYELKEYFQEQLPSPCRKCTAFPTVLLGWKYIPVRNKLYMILLLDKYTNGFDD